MIHARAIPALITLILVMPFIKVSDHAMAQSPNLLTNPDFEDEGRWLFQDGVREIAIPPGGWFARLRRGVPARQITCRCLQIAHAVLTLAATGRVPSFVT